MDASRRKRRVMDVGFYLKVIKNTMQAHCDEETVCIKVGIVIFLLFGG